MDIIAAFLEDLRDRTDSEHTHRNYEVRLGHLDEFLASRSARPLEAREEDLIAYREHMRSSEAYSDSSAAVCLSAARSLYAWARSIGHLEADPSVEVLPYPVRRSPTKPLTDEEWTNVYEGAVGESGWAATRDIALLALFGWDGLKTGDVARLDWQDVDPSFRHLSAGTDRRMQDLHPESRRALRGLHTQSASQNGGVFMNQGGGQLSARSIRASVGTAGKRVGIGSLNPNLLRVTAFHRLWREDYDLTTLALRFGATLNTVKRNLGLVDANGASCGDCEGRPTCRACWGTGEVLHAHDSWLVTRTIDDHIKALRAIHEELHDKGRLLYRTGLLGPSERHQVLETAEISILIADRLERGHFIERVPEAFPKTYDWEDVLVASHAKHKSARQRAKARGTELRKLADALHREHRISDAVRTELDRRGAQVVLLTDPKRVTQVARRSAAPGPARSLRRKCDSRSNGDRP